MIAKRIIACLDIKDGRTVKGINFSDLKDAGDPVSLAKKYADEGIDELVFLDINASYENRTTIIELVRRISENINIPFSIGGGINDVSIAYQLLQSGADKVSINTAAIKNPLLIREISDAFGTQSLIVAIDAKMIEGSWNVFIMGGRINTHLDLYDWAMQVEQLGAGEILFTSIDHDGSKEGFAIESLQKLNSILSIPIVASGGAGKMKHFLDVFRLGKADAALAASVFHYREIEVDTLKKYLIQNNISIRP